MSALSMNPIYVEPEAESFWDRVNRIEIPYEKILLISAILLSVIAAWIFIAHDFHNVHFDSKGHQLVPRRILDSLRPGWIQIGAFWLPLPHVLYLPLVANDYIYFNGLAGIPFSMISFVLTVMLLFRLGERVVDRFSAFCASALYLTNPNMLYLQATSLTENLSLLFFVWSVYLFVRFFQEQKRSFLWGCAIVSAAGILTRYENWFSFAFTGVILILLHWKEKLGWKNLITNSLIYGVIPVIAMAFSFWISWYTTGLLYHDHSYKHQDYQPAKGSFFLSFMVILYTVGELISYEWVLFALIAFFLMFRKRFRETSFLATLGLLAPFVLYLYEYFDNHPTRVRYGLPFVPAFFFYLSYWPGRMRMVKFLFIVVAVFVALFSPFYRSGSSELLNESLRDQENIAVQKDLYHYLRANDDGTLILVAMGDIAPVIYDLKLPLKRFVHEGVKPWWTDANKEPQKVVGWVFLNQDDKLWQKFHNNPEFHRHFALVGRRNFLELYRRSSDEEFNLKSHPAHGLNERFVTPRIPGL